MGFYLTNGHLPFSEPCLGREEWEAVERVFRRNWYTTGPETGEFEREFREYLGCRCAVALHSATAALHVALLTLGIGAGDEVMVTPFTFVSTVNTIFEVGAFPVFVDIDENDYMPSPEALEETVRREFEERDGVWYSRSRGGKLKAIMVVHYAGQPAKLEEIEALAQKYRLAIVEDAAHAVGASIGKRKIGTGQNLTCFSFYSNKNMTSGEGGMVTCDEIGWEKALRMFSLHGIDKEAYARLKGSGMPFYDVKVLGYKYNMTDLQGALGRAQLKKVELFNKKRRELADLYTHYLGEVEELAVRPLRDGVTSSRHLFVAELLRGDRDELLRELLHRRIQCSVHFRPVHLFTYHKERLPYKEGDFPKAEAIFERILSLPLFPTMEEEDVAYVVESVKTVLARSRG